jgi:4'-phosphopantetheinyl transferase
MLPPWVLPPEPGECHVWWADAVPVRLDGLAVLDTVERQRLAGWHLLADRNAYGTAAVVLRAAVGGYLDLPPAAVRVDRRCVRCALPHGAPRLRGPASVYSVSAATAGRRVGVAISRAGTVGIGMQWLASPRFCYGEVLTAMELADVAELPERARPAAVAVSWAAKQAVRRAAAPGTAPDPLDFAVAPVTEPPAVVGWPEPAAAAPRLYALHPAAGYTAALAVHSPVEIDVCEYDGTRLLDVRPAAVRASAARTAA